MKKSIRIIILFCFSTILLGCSPLYNADWSFQNWTKKKTRYFKYSDYKSPAKDEDKSKVIFIVNGLDGYDIYDYRNSTNEPAIRYINDENAIAYDFPSKKIDFGFVLPSDLKGKTAYSFYMRPEPHTIRFEGMEAAIIKAGKTCSINYNFYPKANKNYVFYFYKNRNTKGVSSCVVKSREIIYENGEYKFLPVN